MRWVFAFPFIILGAFLFALKIDNLGIIGQINKLLIGIGCFYIAAVIVKVKKQ